MRTHPVEDVSRLPTYGFGPVSPMWWGTLGLFAVEGMGFVLAIGMYLYLWFVAPQPPPGLPAPSHWPGTLALLALLASWWPNALAAKAGKEEDLPRVRVLLVIMTLVALVIIGIRFYEFWNLPFSWDANGYASTVWFILGLHAAHVITDAGDTIVLAVLMFTRHGHGKRFSDVHDNAFYWYFVIVTWIPLYLLIYWFPRI
ncbi:MAG TPA: cytochrome c oxidase subunit 3 [Geminicoccus sp.]|uniref:cytochrome c oxidase subunit 3 n=1 Tax=Geminicoccus sp. TaxID=2024832 RepID=UPI002E2F0463|nr:cytochrome c oxidase subunit 3 [Geminicoccus sp.]HEX2528917.1 cytochrome c oxidase subunit 3 [Geminicoccus sp.]